MSQSDLRRQAWRSALPKHCRAHKPYRPIHWNRAHKLAAGLPDRAQRAFWALLVRSREVQSGIVYVGNRGLGQRVERCGRTIQRAKPQLRASGLVAIIPGGGKTINEFGQCVEAATGYELADVLFPPEKKSAIAAKVTPAFQPAARARELAARFMPRAGP